MGREWRRLALAALAAAAVALTGVLSVQAQTPTKTAKAPQAKKAPEKAPEQSPDDEEEELKPKAAPKKKKVDAAEAQRTVEAAGKLVEAGKSDQAIQSLTATLTTGGLPPATMAKAFLYRGLAYRQQQKPAQAISDIMSALWINGGLSQADRTSAMQQRAAAYQEAGLTESGEPLVATAPVQTPVVRTKPPAEVNWGASTTASTTTPAYVPTAPTPEPTQAPKQVAEPSGGSWFNGWFGSGSSQQQPQQQPAGFQTTTTKAQPEPKASSWTNSTEVKAAPKEIETASIKPPKPEGRFRVQVAMVRSQEEALAVAAKVKRDYGLGGEPEIDQAVVGNMGAFYRVRVGPFASQNEGQAACAKLKGSGLDCLVVAQ